VLVFHSGFTFWRKQKNNDIALHRFY
jgi:hypothetical protein